MKYPISGCTTILVGLLGVLIASGQVHASSQWPFPYEAYPRDVVYAHYVLQQMAENSRFHSEEELLQTKQRRHKDIATMSGTDRSIVGQQPGDDHEYYDFWTTR